ncbi:hypothetical protein [Pedobacter sp. L105]|uniref:hypothetical protein n=1 Tax=Pedobacter sp. L105 TaxID=1641871 RepID=UPI00131EA23E|nr:hypothetical protein [Pedobacter sp. L105]
MDEYTIAVKHIDKPTLKGIVCFLADAKYDERDIANDEHRSKTMCWIGHQEIIEREILEAGNVQKVINDEISQFRHDFSDVVQELYRIGRYSQVQEMMTLIEEFISGAIENMYD